MNGKIESKRTEERRHQKWKVYSQNDKFTLSPTLVEEENLRVFILKNTNFTWIVRQEIDLFFGQTLCVLQRETQ